MQSLTSQTIGRLGLGFSVAAVLGTAVAAVASIWLLMTDPLTVADAVAAGEIAPLVRALAGILYDSLRGLARYL